MARRGVKAVMRRNSISSTALTDEASDAGFGPDASCNAILLH